MADEAQLRVSSSTTLRASRDALSIGTFVGPDMAPTWSRHGDEHPMKLEDEVARLLERLAKDLYER